MLYSCSCRSRSLRIVYFGIFFVFIATNNFCNGLFANTTENFQSFTNEWIVSTNKSSEAIDIIPGVKLFNAFGVGYLLAAINGKKLWNIPTDGIEQALRTPEESIVNEYSLLLKEFSNKNFSASSVVYTRFDNITREQEPNLEKLSTQIEHIDFINDPHKFWSAISEQVSNGTHEQLKDELIPEVMWQKVFENTTQGAFINTLYHKSHWDVPWKDAGEKSFNYDTIIKFYEREGEFKVLESDSFSAVQIDIQKNSKKLIFVKPYAFMDLAKMREEIQRISVNSEKDWIPRKLRVQVPALNVTNLSRNYQGLVKMGISDAFCRSNESDPEEYKFELQPIAQANHFEFSETFIEIASATGAIINYNKFVPKEKIDLEEQEDDDESEDYPADEPEAQSEEVDLPLGFFEARRLKLKSVPLSKKLKYITEGKCEKPEEFGISHRKSQSGIHNAINGEATLVFDTPFFYLVHDNELGEVFSGVVNSLCQYKKVSDATKSTEDHTWLHDVFKVAFWKCV